MPMYRDDKWEKHLAGREALLWRRRWEKRRQPKAKLRIEHHATTAQGGRQSHDMEALPDSVISTPCDERGCLFSAKYRVYDQWGSQVYCRAHCDHIRAGRSLETRGGQIPIVGDRGDNSRHWDGFHMLRKAPLPLTFGLRTPSYKLTTCGKALIQGLPVSTASRMAAMSTSTARTFAAAAGIRIIDPYAKRHESSGNADTFALLLNGHGSVELLHCNAKAKANSLRAMLASHRKLGSFRWAVRVLDGTIKISRLGARAGVVTE